MRTSVLFWHRDKSLRMNNPIIYQSITIAFHSLAQSHHSGGHQAHRLRTSGRVRSGHSTAEIDNYGRRRPFFGSIWAITEIFFDYSAHPIPISLRFSWLLSKRWAWFFCLLVLLSSLISLGPHFKKHITLMGFPKHRSIWSCGGRPSMMQPTLCGICLSRITALIFKEANDGIGCLFWMFKKVSFEL